MARQKGSDILLPNLGVYFNVPPIAVPERGLQDCRNVRITEGQLTSFNVGWQRFSTLWTLNGIVKLIDNFFDSAGSQKLIFATPTDLYEWVEVDDSLRFLTPRYGTGTVSINNGSDQLAGAGGTAWLSSGIKAGDRIYIGGLMRGTDTDVPRYIDEGAGAAATAPAACNIPYPTITTADAGNLLLLYITAKGDVTNAPVTPAGWAADAGGIDEVGSPATGQSFCYRKRCVGTEAGTLAVTMAAGTARFGGRMFMFRSSQDLVATGTPAAGTSATLPAVDVTTVSDFHIAINLSTVHNGGVVPAFTGETSGNWTKPVSNFVDGANFNIVIHTALVPTSGAISGGTSAITSGDWGNRGFAVGVPVWYTVESVDSDVAITLVETWQEANVAALPYVARRLLTSDANDIWSTELFYNGLPGPTDWWIATNGIDDVLSWNGTAPAATYQNLGFTCKTLIKWNNMIIYANLNVGGAARRTSIRNSDVGSPLEVEEGVAAEFIVHDGVDEILALLTIADNLVVYSIRNVSLVAFVGFPELFAFRQVVAGIGPLSGNSIADFGDNHEWIGSDAAYIFDGVTADEVNYHVMREIIRTCPAQRYNQIIAHFAEETGEIYWIVPLTTDTSQLSPSTAYSEHYLENVPEGTPTPFTIRDMPATATGYFESLNTLTWDEITTRWSSQSYRWDDRFFTAAFPLNLFGTEDGKVMIIGVADDQDGVAIESFVRFARRPVIDGLLRGCVKRVYVFAARLGGASYDLDVTVTTTDQVGGEGVAGTVLPYNLRHEGRRFVNPFAIGRFFDVTFGTTGTDRGWVLQGYDVENTALGERDAPT